MLTKPYRIGTSSYIIPDDILPNIRYLAGKVRDVELVLFEVDDGQNNLPDQETLGELVRLACNYDLTYTVHLPLDLKLGADGDERHISLLKAQRVIEVTKEIHPWSYVVHLDGRELRDHLPSAAQDRWANQAIRALEIVADWTGGMEFLAVENLEGYPLDFWDDIFRRIPVGRCVDIGHLWRDGHDPIPYLTKALDRTRVIHIHGIAERDHQSLAHVRPDELDRVLSCLMELNYTGVMTVEVFGENDFVSSIAAIQASYSRLGIP